jgi:hypothetical protein
MKVLLLGLCGRVRRRYSIPQFSVALASMKRSPEQVTSYANKVTACPLVVISDPQRQELVAFYANKVIHRLPSR